MVQQGKEAERRAELLKLKNRPLVPASIDCTEREASGYNADGSTSVVSLPPWFKRYGLRGCQAVGP